MNNIMELFKEDLQQYQMILDNYESLTSEDGVTAYELSKMCILTADRWNEIAFNASKYAKEYNVTKTALYNWAYHRYRILSQLHEFCRVVWRQCEESSRTRMND